MKFKEIIAKISERIGIFFLNKYLKFYFYNKKKNSYLNERSIEYEFVLNNLLKYECLDVLDIGTGSNSFSSTLEHCGYNVISTDSKTGNYWLDFRNRHTYVVKNDITDTKLTNKFDAVICISTLEHIRNFKDAVQGMVSAMKKKSILIMTFPYTHKEYCENVYKLDEADNAAKNFRYIGQSFSNNEIQYFCKNFRLKIVGTQFIKGWSDKFWRTGNRLTFTKKISDYKQANAACFVFTKKNN